MQRKPGIISAAFLIWLVLFPGFAPLLVAQTSPPPPTGQELDQLLAPIALYPDALLAQITTASTNPQEVLDVTNWLAKNPSLTGTELTDAAQKQGYDPAFIALVTFPKVLQMMADHIDDYAAIGQAVTANQAEVADSVQRLRAEAYDSGALRTNQQQTVEVQQNSGQPAYVIQPANPLVLYVPEYDPTVVYVRPSTSAVVTASLISFGVGIGIGALVYNSHPWGWGGWGWGWGGRRGIYYNRGPWGGGWVGGYRPPVVWYRPRPVVYSHYPGYGGNWGYRPPNYRPPHPGRPPSYRPPGSHPGSPGYRPPGNRPGNPGHRPPPNGGRPGQPGTRPPGNGQPGNRPGQPGNKPGQPGTRPPGNGGQPGNKPGQPGSRPPGNGNQPGTRPGTRPGTGSGQPGKPGNSGTRPGGSNGPGNVNDRPDGSNGRPGGSNGRPGGSNPSNGNRPAQKPPTQSRPAPKPAQHSKPAQKPANHSRPAPQARPEKPKK
jgi:Protein of unknown function (DUF3300)